MRIFNQLLSWGILVCCSLVFLSTNQVQAQWTNTTGFEDGWGIWNDGGSDAYRLSDSNFDLPGDYCVRIRDNSGKSSSIYTDKLDFAGYSNVNIDFKYEAASMEYGEDFFLEYSNDGGNSFEKIKTYASGNHFNNGQLKTESVSIDKTFNNNCVFRFRCDASANYDMIYIDDIKITAGGNNGTRI